MKNQEKFHSNILRKEYIIDREKVRSIKIIAENINKCPDWHSKPGGKAWLFVDEIDIIKRAF